MNKIHFESFIHWKCVESIHGPDLIEEYGPLCGIRADTPLTTDDLYEVTCERCRRILYPDIKD